jgi:molybdate transport system substrate-binding protein
MATQRLLDELAELYEQRFGCEVAIESVGGVVAEKRVMAGEPFDMVFLSSAAIDKLIDAQRVVAGSRVDLVRSSVAVAVRAASSIGYSTGPSGVQMTKLFERWGIADEIKNRIVQAPPGVPVGSLIAKGEVEFGFQQLGELMHVEGIEVLGTLPPAIQIVTVFSAGTCIASNNRDAVKAVLEFMKSPAANEAKRRQGTEPA